MANIQVHPTMMQQPHPAAAAGAAMKYTDWLAQQNRTPQVEDFAQMLNADSYEYFDTFLISTAQCGGNVQAPNWAGLPNNGQLGFFTKPGGGITNAMSNAEDTNKFSYDFLFNSIMVEPFCDIDAPSSGGIATQQAWAEIIAYYSAFILTWGNTKTQIYLPSSSCPSGSGVDYGVKLRTQGVPTFTDVGSATNGQPTATARRMQPQPIFIPKQEQFQMTLQLHNSVPAGAPTNATALARAQALAPLSGNFQAGVKLKLSGVRGQPLLIGSA